MQIPIVNFLWLTSTKFDFSCSFLDVRDYLFLCHANLPWRGTSCEQFVAWFQRQAIHLLLDTLNQKRQNTKTPTDNLNSYSRYARLSYPRKASVHATSRHTKFSNQFQKSICELFVAKIHDSSNHQRFQRLATECTVFNTATSPRGNYADLEFMPSSKDSCN